MAAGQPRLAARHARPRARRPGRTPWRRRRGSQSGHRWGDWWLAELSTLAGDHEDASKRLRVVCDWLEATEQPGFLETYLPLSAANCACSAASTKRSSSPSARDRSKRTFDGAGLPLRQVLARVHAHRGELAEAERLAREAVAASERTDSLDDQCLVLWDLAEVLAAAGRLDEAAAALEQALDRCQRKKNLALARQVRERLAELRAETQPAP